MDLIVLPKAGVCFELGDRHETAIGYEKYQMFRFSRGRLNQRKRGKGYPEFSNVGWVKRSAPIKSLGVIRQTMPRCVAYERILRGLLISFGV